jgi:hypothetical protein
VEPASGVVGSIVSVWRSCQNPFQAIAGVIVAAPGSAGLPTIVSATTGRSNLISTGPGLSIGPCGVYDITWRS